MQRIWRSRGYLPHWDWPRAVQFITFRLGDSLPADFTKRWHARIEANPDQEWLRAEMVNSTDEELDSGRGACHLRDSRIASLVEEALLHFDGDRYSLLSWVVMPNHVHVLIELNPAAPPLHRIVHSWKWHTGKAANNLLRLSGRFWQPDYFDRLIRDDEQLHSTRLYVEFNPVKAGLCKVPSDWSFGSARFSEP